MLKIIFEEARRFLNNIVRPRPHLKILEVPRSDRQSCCRNKSRRRTVMQYPSDSRICYKRSTAHTTSNPTTHFSAPSIDDGMIHTTNPHPLKSYRQMKHRNIGRLTTAVEERQRDPTRVRPSMPPRTQLRRFNRRISRLPTKHITGIDSSTLQHAANCPPRNPYSMTGNELLSSHGEDGSVTSSQYVTAPSAFSDWSDSEDTNPVLQVSDADSGVIFEEVRQGTNVEAQPAQLVLNGQIDQGNCFVAPTNFSGQTLRDERRLAPFDPYLPAFTLTIPTPQLPPSPVFVLKSPITVSKFVSASSNHANAGISTAIRGSPAPMVPACDRCRLAEPESSQCYSCYQQWLACKVWYQANDGGRRAWLTEPYIKPAESNAINRAVTETFWSPERTPFDPRGLGILTDALIGSSIQAEGFPRLLASSTGSREVVAWKPRRGGILLLLAESWRASVNALKSKLSSCQRRIALEFKTLRVAEVPDGWSCHMNLGSEDDALLDACFEQPHRRAKITSSSKFVEQLFDSPSNASSS